MNEKSWPKFRDIILLVSLIVFGIFEFKIFHVSVALIWLLSMACFIHFVLRAESDIRLLLTLEVIWLLVVSCITIITHSVVLAHIIAIIYTLLAVGILRQMGVMKQPIVNQRASRNGAIQSHHDFFFNLYIKDKLENGELDQFSLAINREEHGLVKPIQRG